MARFERGQWVLGRYRGGKYHFPGVVQDAVGGFVTIGYDDGERESLPEADVKPYDWGVGARIHAVWSGNGHWYDATIVEIHPNGSNLVVRFDDGIVEQTVTARCRSVQDRPEGLLSTVRPDDGAALSPRTARWGPHHC